MEKTMGFQSDYAINTSRLSYVFAAKQVNAGQLIIVKARLKCPLPYLNRNVPFFIFCLFLLRLSVLSKNFATGMPQERRSPTRSTYGSLLFPSASILLHRDLDSCGVRNSAGLSGDDD